MLERKAKERKKEWKRDSDSTTKLKMLQEREGENKENIREIQKKRKKAIEKKHRQKERKRESERDRKRG